ncbi:hypothetical protein [Polaribacter sp. KT 15]|uniref:hypothetical protein n=1 Tax=Polaribacter sp. KT 15 TaxID=1896175 RepID=UPI00090B96AD|nr:hypothetical protein [Polaribacter sp. KT 15]SHM92018.1 hypothetical protein SAMN05720268_1406 [Polaribacter sp. KT 15]
MLFLTSFGAIVIFGLLLILVITALVLASKSESNLRFLIWGAIILFVPFLGAIACIINYYATKNKVKSA